MKSNSRRGFLKATGKVLPVLAVLGGMIATAQPARADCASTCNNDCTGDCKGTCFKACNNDCSGTCVGTGK